ncbi:MAG TPA: GPP34 family phosphoprotein [Actinocrinis sp.]|nr:GPP34 family phosphoprotein [Actinocrinis sp.]
MGLGIDLTLLAVDAEPGYLRVGPTLPYPLVVGELVDLAVAGRITVNGDVIEVLDRSPVGDALADDSLARLADLGDGLSVEQWLERQGRWRVEAYLNGLRHQNVLHESSGKVVGSGRIEVADTLRAAAPVRRLRRLIAEEGGPQSAQDLAFAALFDRDRR